jgi:hypothetical protein
VGSEDELDSGRWQKRVTTFDGPFDLTLTLPFLLEAEAGDPFAGLTRMADRSSVRLRQSGLFDSLESVDVGEDEWLTQHARPRRAGSRTSSRSRKRSR